MSRWTFLAFVTLAGCAMFPRSDDAPGTAGADIATGTVVEPKSGSRLRALAWKRGTDVVATGTFRDTKLDTYCQFGATKDGTRCLPLGGNSPSAYANAYPLFLDSACTSPGVAASRFDGTELHPRFARVTELATTTCGSYTSVVALGPAIGQRDAWIKAGDRCVAWKVPNEYDDARSFTPVANTDLVLGTEDRATVTADLAAGRVRGEDGSVAPNALFDTRRDAMCWPDASGHCLPGFPAHAVPNQFVDTACSEPAAYFARSWGLGTDPCRPRVVSAYAACSTTITFFEVGAKIDRWYQKYDTQCAPIEANASFDYYRLGQPIPIGSFPTATFAKQGGLLRTTMPSGAVVATSFLDRAGNACHPMWTSDGKYRCVPQPDAYVGDELGDAACTQRVYTEAPTSCAPTTPALRHLAVDYAHGQLFDVAAPREGSVYRLVNGTCQLSRTATVYDLTPASLATFDELTLSEESCHPTLGTCSETCSGDATCNGGFCSASVCLAKIANNQPLPSELGACGPDVAKRACMSGACSADGKCGVARGGACTKNDECREDPCFQGKCQRPPSSSSSSSGGATAGDDDDDSSAPEKPSASSGSSAPPLPHPSPQTATPDAPGCSTSPRPTGWPVGTFALVALVLYVSCRRHTR